MSQVGYIKPEDWTEVEEFISKTIYHARHGRLKPVCSLCGANYTPLTADDYLCEKCHDKISKAERDYGYDHHEGDGCGC